jgi:pimeloyl-ACP methyl ester carboxylesterase
MGSGQVANLAAHKILYSYLEDGFNVVHIHTRGAGLSQLPLSNSYDRYLRNPQLVGDAEAVRTDLGIERWDLVAGHSYGALLAHEYAYRHPDRVNRLFLTGSPSYSRAMLAMEKGHLHRFHLGLEARMTTLRKILATHAAFGGLRTRPELIAAIIEDSRHTGTEILPFVDFRNVVAGRYYENAELRREYPVLNRSADYFQAQVVFDFLGSAPVNARVEQLTSAAAAVIAYEALEGRVSAEERFRYIDKVVYAGAGPILEALGARNAAPFHQQALATSKRLRVVLHAYAGLNVRFAELLAIHDGDLRKALEVQGNAAANIESPYQKIGLEAGARISAWDAASYRHNVPTLLIHGEDDVLAPVEGAVHYYEKALTGTRILISVPGVAHNVDLADGVKEWLLLGFVKSPATEFLASLNARSAQTDWLRAQGATIRSSP